MKRVRVLGRFLGGMVFCGHLVMIHGGFAAEAAVDWQKVRFHPGLFLNESRWNLLKQQVTNDPVSAKIFAIIKKSAENSLDLPPVAYVDKGAFWHGPMRQAQGRILSLAMSYRLTGDPRFLTRARLEMKTMADLPNWYPQHFLDAAEGALGMSIGLDWLGGDLSEKDRGFFSAVLVRNALRPSLQVADKGTWVSGNNNWTAVCHAGMVAAALAVGDREPELARRVIERALANMPRYAGLYAPAGAYSEGPDYWAYGTTFYVLMTEALRTQFGNSYRLEQASGFLQTADYTMQMTAPSGLLFNFADNGSSLGFEPVMFWFARELKRSDLIQRELFNLDRVADSIIAGATRDDASRMLPLALIWRDAGSQDASSAARPLQWWSGEGSSQPQAVLRSAWNDPRAAFLGIKAGRANDSHAHMDIGSFIFEAEGVRWAVDLGRESYPHARANGIPNADLFDTKQNARRWEIFRCGPESHNLLRFDKAWALVDAKAEIQPMPGKDANTGFVVDLSPVVQGQVASAKRYFNLLPDRGVDIRDEWKAADRSTEVTWQWLTFADAMSEADGFKLRQSGQELVIRAKASTKLVFSTEDLWEARNKFDSPNPGLRRLTIRLQTPAGSNGWLQVQAIPVRPN